LVRKSHVSERPIEREREREVEREVFWSTGVEPEFSRGGGPILSKNSIIDFFPFPHLIKEEEEIIIIIKKTFPNFQNPISWLVVGVCVTHTHTHSPTNTFP
jgi:hypothetical protein